MSTVLLALCACAVPRPGATPPALSNSDGVLPDTPAGAMEGTEQARLAGWYVVQFRSATLPPRRADGSAWHQKRADNTAVVLGGLFGLAIGHPAIGLSMGEALADGGGDPLAPAPYVALKLSGNTYRISAVHRTYSPTWQQPIVVDTRSSSGSEAVVIQIMDAIDDSLIAQHELALGDLLSQPTRTLTNLGAVASLDVEVRPADPRQRAEYDLVVPGNASLQTLLQGRSSSWTVIPVWNGDTITIHAAGSVCPSTMSSDCFGPDGAGDGWRSYNYDGFKEVPHASLIAVFPGANYHVGASRRLRAEQSGQILLFANDSDASNNRGAFKVHVIVDPPR